MKRLPIIYIYGHNIRNGSRHLASCSLSFTLTIVDCGETRVGILAIVLVQETPCWDLNLLERWEAEDESNHSHGIDSCHSFTFGDDSVESAVIV